MNRLLIATAVLFLASPGCRNKESATAGLPQPGVGQNIAVPAGNKKKMSCLDDIADKRIAVLLGSVHDTYATQHFPKAAILEFQNIPDIITALKAGKVDVAFSDHIALRDIFEKNDDLGLLAANISTSPIAAAFNKETPGLRDQFNTFLREIRSNGIYDDMIDRWMTRAVTELPETEPVAMGEPLRVGILSDAGLPSAIRHEGKLIGLDIELSMRFAAFLGRTFEPVDIPFPSMIASLAAKKTDIVTCQLIVTEERKKLVDFSDPYLESGMSVYARKDNIEQRDRRMAVLDDIADKRVAVFTGTVHDLLVSEKYPKASLYRYESPTDMVSALLSDKTDAAMLDQITAMLVRKGNPSIGLLTDSVLTLPLGVGFSKKNPRLREEFNRFLADIRTDGTYEKMHQRWFTGDADKAEMPSFPEPGSGKKLVAGTNINDLPYVALVNGELAGFDIELLKTFASRMNYNIEFLPMQFASLVPALAAGKVDLVSDGIAITKERAKQIDFSDSYADFRTAVIALKSKLAAYGQEEVREEKKPIFRALSDSFYSNIVHEKRYLLILNGLKLTILISVFSAILGTLIGGLICFLRMSKRALLRVLASVYITILRGTPVLVLLMIIFYVVFASVNINPSLVAVIAFGLNFGAYVSEMFRTSIESVDRGQKEAGIAGGFTKVQTFVYIIMPQAVRQVLPVYKGEFISLVKMTSVVGYIAVQDLTKASDIIRSRTFDAFFPLIMAAVIYLAVSWLLTWSLGYLEIRVNPRGRRSLKTRR